LHDARPYQVETSVKDGAVKEAGEF